MSDFRYSHGTEIHTVRASNDDDAADLVAIGGESSVVVLQITASNANVVATFAIGSRITALAWSSRSISPTSSDEWIIELSAASADFGLHLLTKSSAAEETVFPFGGGLSGHHGKVTDMTFCGGRAEDSARYVATVSDDKTLLVWDLQPRIDISSGQPSPARSPSFSTTPSNPGSVRPQPTAYVIPFPHPLTTVDSHPSTSKELLVSDCRGSVFLTDWRSDPSENSSRRHSSLVELVDPRALADAQSVGGSVAWRRDTVDIVGGTFGTRFSLWDVTKYGGKPSASGTSFTEGGHRFRWCPTYPDFFAISTQSPAKGGVIHVHNAAYVHAQPTVFNVAPRPHRVRDFDFVALPGIPRVAAAVGRDLFVFSIGVEP
ncbi:hypothetical protein PLICRDRAFT_110292 [Plicaturopsis crispa FD-325 SS-3]|nr:hypothetical protein PLICRDRAFT_110292 [Plicaturopsis crispa FD-325 SS-3]